MDHSASPVIRGEFVYQGALFVDVGGLLKRHPRVSLGDLESYLDGKVPRDQVAHWYEAQLIHYGLQRSKDKNTAKVRLQQAINQKKLTVPPHILDMEGQMKRSSPLGPGKLRLRKLAEQWQARNASKVMISLETHPKPTRRPRSP